MGFLHTVGSGVPTARYLLWRVFDTQGCVDTTNPTLHSLWSFSVGLIGYRADGTNLLLGEDAATDANGILVNNYNCGIIDEYGRKRMN